MKIDAQVYFWKYEKTISLPVIRNNKLLQQHYLPEQLTQNLHRNGVEGCIAVVAETAEVETVRALSLATNGWEVAMMRRQLLEIRRMNREGNLKPTWTKSLTIPVVGLGILLGLVSLLFMVTK